MSLPRSLLDAPLADLDLELRSGAWPEGLAGEVFVSTSERATAPIHGFFGDGVMIRLSLTPGTHGAPPGRFAWRHRVLDTPTRRLREARPDVWQASGLGWSSPFGFANAANTAPLPWDGRLFATWDVAAPSRLTPSRCGSSARSASVTRGATTSSARRSSRCSRPRPTPRSTPSAGPPVEHALAPAHRRGARHPVGRRHHHGAPPAPRRRDAAPVDAHRRPDPRPARARRPRLPGRPRPRRSEAANAR